MTMGASEAQEAFMAPPAGPVGPRLSSHAKWVRCCLIAQIKGPHPLGLSSAAPQEAMSLVCLICQPRARA